MLITVNNAERLVEACDFLLLEDLKTRCQEFMVGQVESSNCIRFFRFAKLYRLELLQVSARRVMLKEFKSVSYTTELKEMSFGELVEYISDDEVNFEVERVMLEAVHGWVRHDPQHRQPSLEAVHGWVRHDPQHRQPSLEAVHGWVRHDPQHRQPSLEAVHGWVRHDPQHMTAITGGGPRLGETRFSAQTAIST